MSGSTIFLIVTATLGYAFLYGPILVLIVYSFNESPLVTVWQGLTTKWYGEVWHDRRILDAVKLSFAIAALNATAATALGTMAGFALARLRRFPGRFLFTGMISATLVVPDVIMGLSLLLLFIAAEQALDLTSLRGATAITFAHVTFSLAFVAIIVQSRLVRMDLALEEAARDLGAKPLQVFRRITLPVIAPALAAGWLLAFTLSLDDLIIASFVSAPGATTLPMLVFSKARLGLNPEVNALGAIIVVLAATALSLAAWWRRGGRARRRGGH